MAIDWYFLEEDLEGNEATTYVPMKGDEVIQNSGVTIGSGIDLGQQSEDSLLKMGVDKSIVDKLTPFFDKSKKKAVKALEEHGPVTLDEDELRNLNRSVQTSYFRDIKDWYNSNNKVDKDWSELSDKQQTVALSVYWNHGKKALTSYNFGKQIANDEWGKVADNLRNFYSSPSNALHSRRIKELQYLIGADIDGIAERTDGSESNTDKRLKEFKENFNSPSFFGNTTTAQHHRPQPAREAPVSLPEGFPEQFMAMMQQVVDSPSRASQEPSEGVTEEEETEPSGLTEAEESLISSAVDYKEPEPEEKAAVEFTEAEESLISRAAGTVETEEPVYADIEGEVDADKDPTYGLF